MVVRSGTSASFRGHKRTSITTNGTNGSMTATTTVIPRYYDNHQGMVDDNENGNNNNNDYDHHEKVHSHRNYSFQLTIYRIRRCIQQQSPGNILMTTIIVLALLILMIRTIRSSSSSSLWPSWSSSSMIIADYPRYVILDDNNPWKVRQSFAIDDKTKWEATVELKYYEGPASVTKGFII